MKVAGKKRSFHFYSVRPSITILCFLLCCSGHTQQPPDAAVRLAGMIIERDTAELRWTYEEALVWQGLEGLWYNAGDARYFRYVQQTADRLVDKDGIIRNYDPHDFNLDNI